MSYILKISLSAKPDARGPIEIGPRAVEINRYPNEGCAQRRGEEMCAPMPIPEYLVMKVNFS